MGEQRPTNGAQGSSKKRKLPPPLPVTSFGRFPGAAILDEVPGDLGTLLWRSAENVETWSQAPVNRRTGLFGPLAAEKRQALIQSAEVPEQLSNPLHTFAGILVDPLATSSPQVSCACTTVAEWALVAGYPRTAEIFARAGAVASPTEAMAAYRAGFVGRRTASYEFSEAWYRRAIALARHTGDWQTYALAKVGLGGMFFQKGATPTAEATLLSALKAARKYRVWSIRGRALHDLFCIAANAGRHEEADRLAKASFRAYGRRSDRLPRLVHDVANAWMLRGQFARALPVLKVLVRNASDPSLQLPFLCSLARAAGAVNNRELYLEASTDAWRLVHRQPNTEFAADSLLNLAHGATSLGDTEGARAAAHFALGVAIYRKESHARLTAEALITWLSQGNGRTESDPSMDTPDTAAFSDELSDYFVRALSTASTV